MSALPPLALSPVAQGFRQPVAVTSTPGLPDTLFVVEQAGTVQALAKDGARSTFLDLTDVVGSGGERGLLSIAFHPKFEANGRLYANYTDKAGDTRVVEFTAQAGTVDPETARELLTVDQPFANHNGGQLAFGPDGMLYIGMGDGGSAGDPQNRAQDPTELLGKILRIDVDTRAHGMQYGIPTGNAFPDASLGAAEIWALGVRNPWRFSFDREVGDLWIGDVGQNALEEINHLPKGTPGGANLGWDIKEGTQPFEPRPAAGPLLDPVHEYSHATGGVSVIGGAVYRGAAIPGLRGAYLYADFGLDKLNAFRMRDGRATDHQAFQGASMITSFGEDTAGEIYATTIDGKLLKVTAVD